MTSVISNSSPGARKTITPRTPSTAGEVMRGREAEQAIVRDLLRRTQHAAGGVVLVEGEPGVGKSRLLLVAWGEMQKRELARAGLTAADVYALLRQKGVDDLGQVGYLLYETRGTTTLIGAGCEPGPLMRDGLSAAGYRDVARPAERHVRR